VLFCLNNRKERMGRKEGRKGKGRERRRMGRGRE
jgi:hypothetical protein